MALPYSDGNPGIQLNEAITVRSVFDTLRTRFRASGITTPDLDARCLIAGAMGFETEDFFRNEDETVSPDQLSEALLYMDRRAKREPVAYILGQKEFWGRTLSVNASVLIPRPDSETIVENLLDLSENGILPGTQTPAKILDIGTGSGCLLIGLLDEFPSGFAVGVDVCPSAVAIARKNLFLADLENRGVFVCGNGAQSLEGEFDIIVANPPYICTDELSGLEPEIMQYEPVSALDGGPNGLKFYPMIAEIAAHLLSPSGILVAEHGSGQQEDVIKIFSSILDERRFIGFRDISGRPRTVAALPKKR